MRKLAIVGAVLAAVVDVAYLAIIATQSGERVVSLRVPFIAGFIALMALSAALGSRRRFGRWAPLLLSASAGGLALTGLLAIFSIGIPLLAAAVLVAVAAVQSLIGRRRPAGILQLLGGVLTAVALFIGGYQLTEIPLACPAAGQAEGSGSGLFSGPYHWSCVNGRMTVTAR